MVTLCLVLGTRCGFVHCGNILYIVYITLTRMIVMYSQCKVNWGTNLFVVFVILYCFFASTAFGLEMALEFYTLVCVHSCIYFNRCIRPSVSMLICK